MSETTGLAQRWQEYRPTKVVWFWSVVAAAVATIVIGFTAGGWTTGGSANQMAELAARDARANLAASMCVQRFIASENAVGEFDKLKETSNWQRDNFIEDGGWVKFAGVEDAIPGASDICAKELMAMDTLPAREAEVVPTASEG